MLKRKNNYIIAHTEIIRNRPSSRSITWFWDISTTFGMEFSSRQREAEVTLMSKRAVSQALSIAIVIAIILAAFGGYAISLATQKTATLPTTFMSTVTREVTQTITLPLNSATDIAGLRTITEQQVVEVVAYYTTYVFGNCTAAAGTVTEHPITTVTSYIFPSNTTGMLNVTIVTTQTESTSTTHVTVSSSLPPQTIYIQNGTVTSISIQSCPVYS